MRIRTALLAVALLGAAPLGARPAKPPADAEVLRLVAGESQVLEVPGVVRVAIGDASVASVKVLAGKEELLVTGVARGSTSLTVWNADGSRRTLAVQVLSEDPRIVADQVRGLLGNVEGVKVRAVGDRVVMEGEVFEDKDFDRVKTVKELYPQVVNFVQKNTLSLRQMVRIDVKLMEVSRSAKRQLGISWPEGFEIAGQARVEGPLSLRGGRGVGDLTGTLGLMSNFGLAFRFMMLDGTGRVLSNPVLLCKSGEKASFLAGGEIPTPAASQYGQTHIEWKPFGVMLRFEPTVDLYGNLSMSIAAESSELDYGNSVQTQGVAVPALTTRKTETIVNLSKGETVVLSELVRDTASKAVSRFPILGQIPILGELFKSRQFQEAETEFLVFVTPALLKPGSLDEKRVREMQETYRKRERETRFFRILD